MTFGIAVSGKGAGLAAVRALAAVERVGRGAIGGFLALAAIDDQGHLHRASAQRGGTCGAFPDGDPPPPIAESRLVALMSSGPDRPDPLAQFVPADPAVGLVTGHRLPHLAGTDGTPINAAALSALAAGATPAAAIKAFQSADPAADAGLIVMDAGGRIALGNSALVDGRDDAGWALHDDPAAPLSVGVLFNSIFPVAPIAPLAIAVALDTVAPADAWTFETSLLGCRLQLGPTNILHLGSDRAPSLIEVTDPAWLQAEWEGSAVLRGARVCQGEATIGHVVREPYCRARNGVVVAGHGGDVATVRCLSPAAA